MKVSLQWLKQYVDIQVPVETLCEKMVMAGFEVDNVEDLSRTLTGVVAARITGLARHPQADKLQICAMDIGGGNTASIITGADNVFEGAVVPAALHEARLPEGRTIKRSKLRGEMSDGMLCSGGELGLREGDYPGAEVDGILILPEDVVPGTDMRQILGLYDTIIDFDVTANRPDCQSVLGIAREVAAVLESDYHPPVPAYHTTGGSISDCVKVTVTDAGLCPRYMGRAVKNLRVAPSPDWMKQALRGAGMRPINNIVDITNYVMLETGQPMHAFDVRDIAGASIVVRPAAQGERMVTLDGRERSLTPDMLVIADAERPSCLAGIMGSLNSGIKEDTTELFLEAAKFRRDNIRKTARTLGLRTESSARFEKGVDICGVSFAMERALQLIDELDAGDVIDGAIDCRGELPEERELTVVTERIRGLLGVAIADEDMAAILRRLHIGTTAENGCLRCRIPSYREDIEGMADLAEEIMRLYGYHHIIGTPMTGTVLRGRRDAVRRRQDIIKRRLTAAGFYEINTYSFIGVKAADDLRLEPTHPWRRTVALRNPLSAEYAVMRSQLVTSMLAVLATNLSRKVTEMRMFEVGRRFIPAQTPGTQPQEIPALSMGLVGAREDFYTVKGAAEAVCKAFGAVPTWKTGTHSFLHPGRQADLILEGQTVGFIGELLPGVAEGTLGMKVAAYVAQMDLTTLLEAEVSARVYKPLPRYPAVERDLALLADEDMTVGALEEIIHAAGGKRLESVRLFDVYRGNQIGAGKKSVAFSLIFRSPEETLTDEQVNTVIEKICRHLAQKGCTLRS